MLLEVSYEALVDAGLATSAISGTQGAVIVGCSAEDALNLHIDTPHNVHGSGYINVGGVSSMLSNRLSFFYNLHGRKRNREYCLLLQFVGSS